RHVGGPAVEEVTRLGAVPRGPDPLDAGAHPAVDGHRTPDPERHVALRRQRRIGADPDADDHEVGVQNVIAAAASTRVAVRTSTPWRASSASTPAAMSPSTSGSTWGSISTTVTARPRAASASAISRPM